MSAAQFVCEWLVAQYRFYQKHTGGFLFGFPEKEIPTRAAGFKNEEPCMAIEIMLDGLKARVSGLQKVLVQWFPSNG